MSVAKVVEVSASSSKGFEDAIQAGVDRAADTVENIKGAWVNEMSVTVEKGKGPYNFNLYIHQWPTRSREQAAQEPLCQWIREGKIRAEEFITHEFALEEIQGALEAVKNGEIIKALLRY